MVREEFTMGEQGITTGLVGDDDLEDSTASIEILARLDQLIQLFGDTKGLEDSSFDCCNNSGSLVFKFGGRLWAVSSLDIAPCD